MAGLFEMPAQMNFQQVHLDEELLLKASLKSN